MLALKSRTMAAMGRAPKVIVGRINCFSVPRPEVGRIPRKTEKMSINIKPSQKSGIDWPMVANPTQSASKAFPCFTAEMIPKGMPITNGEEHRAESQLKRRRHSLHQ